MQKNRGARRFHRRGVRVRAVLESKADVQERGQASRDDGDAMALTFAQQHLIV
jgi:hypothetical protein